MARAAALAFALLLGGCFFPDPGEVSFASDDDDAVADDDDTVVDDDDTVVDDDDTVADDDDTVVDDDDTVADDDDTVADDDDTVVDDDDTVVDDDDTVVDDDDSAVDDDDTAVDDDDTAGLDADGDGFTVAQGDCDDGAPARHPGAPEVFDLAVNDCLSGDVQELRIASLATERVAGSLEYQYLGDTLGVGDLDGDGAADLCVRAYRDWGPITPDVFVFLDVEAQLAAQGQLVTAGADATITGFAGNGSIDCSHDLDGDGSDDLVVASWRETTAGSGFYTFTRGAGWANTGTITAADADHSIEGSATDEVGHCFGIGDLLDEPGLEIALGQTSNTDPANRVRSIGLWDASLSTEHRALPTTGSEWTGYRCDIVPDVTGGGYDELLVDDTSEAFLTLGETINATAPASTPVVASSLDAVPTSVAGADLDGDGLSELIVGYPYFTDTAGDVGGVWVFLGTFGSGAWSAGISTNDGPTPGRGLVLVGGLDQGLFGQNVSAVGDLTGDGIPELAVSASGYDITDYVGQVLLYAGRSRADWTALGDPVLEAQADSVLQGFGSSGPAIPQAEHLGDSYGRWSLGWEDPATGLSPGVWASAVQAAFGSLHQTGGALHWGRGEP